MDEDEIRDIAVYRAEGGGWVFGCSAEECALSRVCSSAELAIAAAVAHWEVRHPEEALALGVDALTLKVPA